MLNRHRRRHTVRGVVATTVAFAGIFPLAIAACGTSTPPPSTGSSSTTPAGGATATYQPHMDFFSYESGLPSVIDPQVFISTPGTPAGVGPQMIQHAAGTSPAPKNGDPATPLLAADGSA